MKKSRNYLFICSRYNDPSDANGICIRNIAQTLIRRGNNVFIIAEAEVDGFENQEGCNVFYLKSINFGREIKNSNLIQRKLFSIIKIIRRIPAVFIYPNVSPFRSRKVYVLAKKLIRQNKIDTIIGAYRPFESLDVAIKLKRKMHHQIRCIVYHLDLLTSPNDSNLHIKNFKIRRGRQFFKKEVEIADAVLLPTSSEYDRKDKIFKVDFPLYINDFGNNSDFAYNKDFFNITYIGSLDDSNRFIGYFSDLIEKVISQTKIPIYFNIWGSINGVKTVDIIEKNDWIHYHGMAKNEHVLSLLSNADCLINIGNKSTPLMIPSKIFQLFAAKRPIINVVNANNDAALRYFEKNDYTCIINAFNKDTQADVQKISSYFSLIIQKHQFDYSKNDRIYYGSTPDALVDIIEKL